MRILSALVLIALLTGPAAAQTAVPRYGEPDKDKTPAEIAADKQAEKDYKRSLSTIPESKSNDPWGIVRSDAPPKAAAKETSKTAPAKPKSEATKSKATDAKSAATRTDSPASPAK